MEDSEVLPTKEGYDRWAKFYDADDIPLNILEERFVESALGDLEGLRVLDLACGTGRQSLKMAARGATVTALDQSDGMLKQAIKKDEAGSVTFKSHNVEEVLPFRKSQFHVVTSFLALEHISDLTPFFEECARVCRSKGTLLFTAMHPAMLLRGVQARFTDPKSQKKIYPKGHPYTVSDYLNAGVRAGLKLVHVHEDWCNEEDIARSERAEKYLNWPLLLGLKFTI